MMFRGLVRLERSPDRYSRLSDEYKVLKRYCFGDNSENVEAIIEQSKKLPSTIIAHDNSLIDVKQNSLEMIKRSKRIHCLHLCDRITSKKMSSMIVDDLMKNTGFIAEINAGSGLLTKELLDAGVKKLHAYEKHPVFLKYLNSLMDKYPGRLEVRPYNLLALRKLVYSADSKDKNLYTVFHGVQPQEFSGPPAIVFVGAVPDKNFLRSLQWSILRQHFAEYGRISLYAAILPSISLMFTDDPTNKCFHRPAIIFLRTFFNYKKLGTVPRNAFFPWELVESWRKRNLNLFIHDTKFMDVVKIEVKEDLINEDFTRSDAVQFFYFLNIHMKKANLRIIPALERWIPGCGPRLIRQNYDIYTLFSELNSQQLLELFKTFKSWPEFETSAFVDLVSTTENNKMAEG